MQGGAPRQDCPKGRPDCPGRAGAPGEEAGTYMYVYVPVLTYYVIMYTILFSSDSESILRRYRTRSTTACTASSSSVSAARARPRTHAAAMHVVRSTYDTIRRSQHYTHTQPAGAASAATLAMHAVSAARARPQAA
jgi:hypothetical protein